MLLQVAMPLRPSKTVNNALPSSAIKKEKLIPAALILGKNCKLQVESKVANLAQKLARFSFFGEEVMRQCTPNGARDLPALPREEVFQLKVSIFDLFPTYWAAPATFEGLWAESIER